MESDLKLVSVVDERANYNTRLRGKFRKRVWGSLNFCIFYFLYNFYKKKKNVCNFNFFALKTNARVIVKQTPSTALHRNSITRMSYGEWYYENIRVLWSIGNIGFVCWNRLYKSIFWIYKDWRFQYFLILSMLRQLN